MSPKAKNTLPEKTDTKPDIYTPEVMEVSSIRKLCMQAVLNINSWHAERAFAKGQQELTKLHGATRNDLFSAKKKLILNELVGKKKQKNSYDRLQQAIRTMRIAHRKWTLAWYGGRLLPSMFWFEYNEEMDVYEKAIWSAVDDFAAEFEELKQIAIAASGTALSEEDYPKPGTIRSHFKIYRDEFPLPDSFPRDLETGAIPAGVMLDKEIENMNARAEAALLRRLRDATGDIFVRFEKVIRKMVEKLSEFQRDPETGKVISGNFHKTLVTNIEELLELAPAFNFVGDPEITKFCEEVKIHLVNAGTDVLKEDAEARAETLSHARRLYEKLNKMGYYKTGSDEEE